MKFACRHSKLKISQWKFLPNFWSSLATVLLFPLFVYLGLWQLERMELKKTLEAERILAIQKEPITIQDLQSALQNRQSLQLLDSARSSKTSDQILQTEILKLFHYRQLSLAGHFIANKNILLDNQVLKGQPGYRILTPFQLLENNIAVLVDRGFIPWGQDRSKLPLIPDIPELMHITGRVTHLSQGFLLKEEPSPNETRWPLQVQTLDYVKLSSKLEQKLYPFLLQLPQNSPYIFQNMPHSLGLTPERHLGYAIQWFTMAIAILIYYLVTHVKRR